VPSNGITLNAISALRSSFSCPHGPCILIRPAWAVLHVPNTAIKPQASIKTWLPPEMESRHFVPWYQVKTLAFGALLDSESIIKIPRFIFLDGYAIFCVK